MKFKSGIPLGAPLGPVLTYFSVVVVMVLAGEMALRISRTFSIEERQAIFRRFEHFFGLLTCLRKAPWWDLQLRDTLLEAKVACRLGSGWHFSRHSFASPREERLKPWNVYSAVFLFAITNVYRCKRIHGRIITVNLILRGKIYEVT